MLGRDTLPPTEVARKFANEYKQPNPQLELILFLDGHAQGKSAVVSGAEAFAGTIDRPALTWLNEF